MGSNISYISYLLKDLCELECLESLSYLFQKGEINPDGATKKYADKTETTLGLLCRNKRSKFE